MYGFIERINFSELDCEKYWSFSKSYKGNPRKETEYMIKSGTFYGSEKKDGFYQRLIKDEDGTIILQSRSRNIKGEYVNKIDFCPQLNDFCSNLPNGTCLLGELYLPNKPGSRNVTTILGCLKDKALARQEKGDKLHYYVFDVWAYNGKSLLKTPIEKRIDYYLDYELLGLFKDEEFVEKANYYDGEELWEELGKILSSGGEGIVMTKKGTVPEPGKRTARKTLKVKQEIENTIDVFLTGNYRPSVREYKGKTPLEEYCYWQNVKTGEIFTENKWAEMSVGVPVEPISRHYALGFAGSVEIAIMKDGVVTPVGFISGITDEMREGIIKAPDKYKNRVFEITAMKIEKKGDLYSFRHGKIKTERFDKPFNECDFSQFEEN